MDVLRAALGEATSSLLRRLLRHQARRDVRRPVPRQGRPDGARRRRRPVPRLASSSASARPAGFERALTAYVDRTASTRATASSATPRRGGSADDQGPARRHRRAAAADLRRPRARQWAPRSTGSITPLYNRDYWSLLDQALQIGAGRRRHLLLQSLADAYASRNHDGTYADNSAEAILAINCLDDPFAITADEVPAQIPDVPGGVADLRRGVRLGPDRLPTGSRCSPPRRPRHPTAAGAAPIVVVGTTRDPATPYEWAVAPRRPARVRRAGQPRRRRAHRLQLGQRLRRRGRRGLPASTAPCRRTGWSADQLTQLSPRHHRSSRVSPTRLPRVKSTQPNASSHRAIFPSRDLERAAHPERRLPLALAEHVGPVGQHDVAGGGRVVDRDVDGHAARLDVEQHATHPAALDRRQPGVAPDHLVVQQLERRLRVREGQQSEELADQSALGPCGNPRRSASERLRDRPDPLGGELDHQLRGGGEGGAARGARSRSVS